MRLAYDRFVARGIAVILIGPEDAAAFRAYWEREQMPFVGLPDPKKRVLKLYGQEVSLFRLGRMPAQLLIDGEGVVRFSHYAGSMSDITPVDELLRQVDSWETPGSRRQEGERAGG